MMRKIADVVIAVLTIATIIVVCWIIWYDLMVRAWIE